MSRRRFPRTAIPPAAKPLLRPKPPQPPSPSPKRFSWRKAPWPFIVSGTVFWGTLTFVGTSYYLAISRPIPDVDPSTIDLNAVYNATAKDFDSGMESTEYWWGIAKLRKKMAGMATGDVLESAAGTGRNSEFYDRSKLKSLVMVDRSQGMMDICKGEW